MGVITGDTRSLDYSSYALHIPSIQPGSPHISPLTIRAPLRVSHRNTTSELHARTSRSHLGISQDGGPLGTLHDS